MVVIPSREGMVTEDIASTSDEAQQHDEGEKEDAQHSEKETGTESCMFTLIFFLLLFRPFYPPSFFVAFPLSILDFLKILVSVKFSFDVHFAVLMRQISFISRYILQMQ